MKSDTDAVPASTGGGGKDDTPMKVAVLPFENRSEEEEIGTLVRKSFYSHFCLKNYHDIELGDVDNALKAIQADSSKTWTDLTASELGQILHADLLIYGKVVEFQKTYLGIYSQISIEVAVEMVNCRTGKGVWWKTLIERSHEGGIPFSLFGIVPEALRSGLHMQRGKTLDLVERVTRELVEQIPDLPPRPAPAYFVDIQVGSFADAGLAEGVQKEFEGKGLNTRVEKAVVEGRLWHRVLVGPFNAPAEAEKAKSTIAQDPRYRPIFVHHY